MKRYLDTFIVIGILAVLLIPATINAAPYVADVAQQKNGPILYVSDAAKKEQSKKEDKIFPDKELKKENKGSRKKLREELKNLSPEERQARMKKIREEREKNAKNRPSEPVKKIIAAEREKRKKARQARQAKHAKETVQLSPEELKKQREEQFKKRLENSSPEEKGKICKRRLERCNTAAKNDVVEQNRKAWPICNIAQKLCSS